MMTKANFTISREIPIFGILAFIINIMSIVWFVSGLNSRVNVLESGARDNAAISEKIAGLDAQVGNFKENIGRIDKSLDRLVDKLSK